MKKLICIFAGGMIGASLRYMTTLLVPHEYFDTLIVNMIGCLCLAFFNQYVVAKGILSDEVAAGIGTGAIGALTTFSTFANENFMLFQAGLTGHIVFYMSISFFGGIAMALLGYTIGEKLFKKEVHE